MTSRASRDISLLDAESSSKTDRNERACKARETKIDGDRRQRKDRLPNSIATRTNRRITSILATKAESAVSRERERDRNLILQDCEIVERQRGSSKRRGKEQKLTPLYELKA